MTKKEKAVLVNGLKKVAADVAEIASMLEDTRAPAKGQESPTETPAPEPEPLPEKVYTYEEVRAVLAEKARNGFREEVKALLASFGMKKLSDAIDQPEVYTVMMLEAEEIGNG